MQFQIERIYLTADFDEYKDEGKQNSNTDVIVVLTNGQKYVASFFAYNNIQAMVEKNKETGDFFEGKYFWAKGMLLIEDCTRELIAKVLEHLIEEGDFDHVFQKL